MRDGEAGFIETGEPIRRTSEIEEVSNLYLIHPIAGYLTPLFAKLGISANAVSVAGMAFGALAGLAYYHYQDLRYAILGLILMFAWHVMDGTDGQLARLTNSQSQAGKILDGICDYVTFISVYSGLGAALRPQVGGWIWALAIVAGFCHIFQSAAYEFQRSEYNFWGLDRKSAEFVRANSLPRNHTGGRLAFGVPDLLYRIYARIQYLVVGVVLVPRERLYALLAREPERAEAIRWRYRAVFAPSVRLWSVMSANYRTLGIFLCAVLKAPQIYFWFEIVGFSLLLAFLIPRQRASYARFFASLDGDLAGSDRAQAAARR